MAECGSTIEDAGYCRRRAGRNVPPAVDAAVCDACGFNDLGMTGCAPELDDVVDPGPDDALQTPA